MTVAAAADRPIALGIAFLYALSLGIATVAIPLVALGAGYDPAAVGFLFAISAGAQLAMRLALPWLLGRFADRSMIGLAGAVMIGSFGLLLASTALPVFVVAQLGQGATRALFWTASQTHAIRSGGSPVRRLVDLNLAATGGTLTGPALAGTLAVIGLPAALVAAILAAVAVTAMTPLLAPLPPYDRRGSAGTLRILRRDGVDLACWANLVGGTWWSMIGSFVPVVLVGAGLTATVIGWLVTLSESAGALTLLVLRRIDSLRIRALVRGGAFVEMLALSGIAVAPPLVIAYALLLVLGGMAAGAVTSLAPALATLAAAEQEQADALALSGTFRSVALLGAPAAVGALLSVAALPLAMVAVAATAAAPGALLGFRGQVSRSQA